MLKLVFLLIVFPLIPLAFAQNDNACDGLTDENPVIITTDKPNYTYYDSEVNVSICMLTDVYHKHIRMTVFDLQGNEIFDMYDPGFPNLSSDEETRHFVQKVPLNSFEKWQKYTIEVHASNHDYQGYFGYGADVFQEYFSEKYNYYIYPTTFWRLSPHTTDDVVRFDAEAPSTIDTFPPYFEIIKFEANEKIEFGDREKIAQHHTAWFENMIQESIGHKLDFKNDIIITDTFAMPNEFLHNIKVTIPTLDKAREVYSTALQTDSGEIFILTLFGSRAEVYDDRIQEFIDSVNTFSPLNDKNAQFMFRTEIVESLIQDEKWVDSKPLDISSDDKTLLLLKFQEIAIMNLDDRKIKEIYIPLDFESYSNISNPQFSKESIDDIFFIYKGDLYKLDTRNDNLQKLIENIRDFDLTNDEKIIYSDSGSTLDDELFSVWMADLDGTNKINILENKKDVGIFDVSFDDSKLLFTKVTYDEPFVNSFLMVYDLNENQFASIPELNVYCGPTPKWSPNSELIIYHYGDCDRHFPDSRIHTFDLAGNSHFLINSDHLTTEFLISNDGIFLYYNLAPEGVYRMTLAQPVPEFGEIIGFVLVLTFLSIILLHKSNYFKSNLIKI